MRLAAALIVMLASCATLPQVAPQPCPVCPEPVTVVSACRDLPPPPVERAQPVAVREGCPEGLVCLDEDSAKGIASELHAARAWQAQVWTLCGPR